MRSGEGGLSVGQGRADVTARTSCGRWSHRGESWRDANDSNLRMTTAATAIASPIVSATTAVLASVSLPGGRAWSHQSNASATGAPREIPKMTMPSHRLARMTAV